MNHTINLQVVIKQNCYNCTYEQEELLCKKDLPQEEKNKENDCRLWSFDKAIYKDDKGYLLEDILSLEIKSIQ